MTSPLRVALYLAPYLVDTYVRARTKLSSTRVKGGVDNAAYVDAWSVRRAISRRRMLGFGGAHLYNRVVQAHVGQ